MVNLAICSECDQGLEHCHGVAIVQLDGTHECSDDLGCTLGIEFHLFTTFVDDAESTKV